MDNVERHAIFNQSNLSYVLACSENYFAASLNEGGNIALWNLQYPKGEPHILIGHHRIVSALSFSNMLKTSFLCSCSTDNIIVWDILQNNGKPQRGRVLLSNNEEPLSCSFNSNNSKIAVSFVQVFRVYDLKTNLWCNVVEEVSVIYFKFIFESEMLVCCEENFLKIFTGKPEQQWIKKVSIPKGVPSALCYCDGITAVGTTSGTIYIFGMNFNLIKSIEIWKLLAHFAKNAVEGVPQDYSNDSFPVFDVVLFTVKCDDEELKYFPRVIYLLVITSTCALIVNINNEDVKLFFNFTGEEKEIGLIRSAVTSILHDSSQAIVILTPLMNDPLILIQIHVEDIIKTDGASIESKFSTAESTVCDAQLSFLNSGNKNEDSILVQSMLNLHQPQTKKLGQKKSKNNFSFPVTFHSRVKSSGYGIVQKPNVMFQPKINKKISKEVSHSQSLIDFQKLSVHGNSRQHTTPLNSFEISPSSFKPENCSLLCTNKFSNTPAVSFLQVTADGKFASCTSSGGIAHVLKFKKESFEISESINCHKGPINSCNWNHKGKLFITCGDDRTAKIWNLNNVHQSPILTFGMECNQDQISLNKHKFVFHETVDQAQFYYLDKFVLASSGNKLYIFDYKIKIENSGIRNNVNKSSLKLIKKIPLSMKRITTFAAVNQFFSNLVLCTGTSKSIDVVDMNTGKVVWHKDDAGTRSHHTIAINEGSPYASQDQPMYDLFLTSAVMDGIKIWDLRTREVVISYKEHKCRSLPCGVTFSACGKFVFSGSEDKSIYMYDLRQLSYLHKIQDYNSDVVTGIRFLSKNAQLLTTTLNGSASLYG